MSRPRSSSPVYIPWWLWVIVTSVLVWYGFRYYQAARTGQVTPALPVRVSVETARAVRGKEIRLISGHWGYDSGALCADGLAEVDVNRRVSELSAEMLRAAGARVAILSEYDSRLEGLEADVLVSIHADSCVEMSGFKVARWVDSPRPERDDRLVQCLVERYATLTGLGFDRLRVTENMTQYHAFRKIAPTTPAAIIEMGYLGGDRALLAEKPRTPALGIAEGVGCFLASWER